MDDRERNIISEVCGYLRVAEAVAAADTCLRAMLEAALERLDRLIPLGREAARSGASGTDLPDDALAEDREHG
jgi:hypothetical protein